jgi:Zn finger protein HypA/HybF involved in hydrogenase expression
MSLDLFHTECGGRVFIDCTKLFSITAVSIGLTKNSVRPSLVNAGVQKKTIETVFICSGCGQSIELEKLVVRCEACRTTKPIIEMVRLNKNGLVSCGECKEKKYKEEEVKELSKIIVKVSVP